MKRLLHTRNLPGKNEEAALGNVAAVDVKNEKNDEKRNNNTSGNTSYLPPKPPVCKFFLKTGKC
eukprot:12882194-Prorocentrum_lima.AAC.1